MITGWALSGYMFAMSVFALAQSVISPELLYGTIRPQWGGSIMGPYVNHNHYAGLMEMLIPISVALAACHSQRRWRSLACIAILVAILSVIISGSRGGLIAVAVEMGLLVYTAASTGRGQRQRYVVLAACALSLSAVALLIWADPGGVWRRWETATRSPETALDLRVRTTPDSLRMFRGNLLKGVGLGAFETAYPQYQTLVSDRVIDFAHNDYAQLAAETGLIGCALGTASIAAFLWFSFRNLNSRLSSPRGWLQMGAATGVCGLLVHSFSDFNLHIPANAAWFAACAACATLPWD
jgi:O-antigen ligase